VGSRTHRDRSRTSALLTAASAALVLGVFWLSSPTGQGGDARIPPVDAAPTPAAATSVGADTYPSSHRTEAPIAAIPVAATNAPATPTDPGAAEQPTTRVHGRVLDQNGLPIARARVHLEGASAGQAETDALGRYSLPEPIPRGARALARVHGEGITGNTPRMFEATAPEVFVDLEVQRLPCITGRIVDTAGGAVAGYGITARSSTDATSSILTGVGNVVRTDERGRFRIFASTVDGPEDVMLVEADCGSAGLLRERPRVRWGTQDVTLTVDPPSWIVVRVQRASDGAPVRRFSLYARHGEHAAIQGWRVQQPRRIVDDTGACTVPALPGQVVIAVVADEPDLSFVGPATITCHAGATETVTLLVPAGVELDVVVRSDGDERPVADADVRAAVGPDATARWLDIGAALVQQTADPRAAGGTLGKGRTDAEGHSQLAAPTTATTVHLRVEKVGYKTAHIEVPATQRAVEVRLQRNRVITGSLHPPTILSHGPAVRWAIEDRGTTSAELARDWTAVAADGTFVLEDVPAGRVRLDLALDLWQGRRMLARAGIARIEAGDDGRELRLDVADCLPGRIFGTAFVDGMPPRALRLHRIGADGDVAAPYSSEAIVGALGNFEFATVPPGAWAISAHHEDVPMIVAMVHGLTAGESRQCHADLRTRSVSITVCDSSGDPLPEGEVVAVGAAASSMLLRRIPLGRGGTLVLESAPMGDLVIEVTRGERKGRRAVTSGEQTQVILR
jgi:hypothetical protein